jgi:hypothetical protein
MTHVYKEFCEVPRQLVEVLEGMTEVVGGSFLVDGSTMTRAEVKRRSDICAKWIMTLRRDLGWSITRILDDLSKALRCELDGIPYTPSREGHSTWTQDNGRDLIWMPPG